MQSKTALTTRIVEAAAKLRIHRVGVVAVGAPRHVAHLDSWLARGLHGDMEYMRVGRAARGDVDMVAPGARTVVVAALAYAKVSPGPIARYARGADYHWVLRDKLEALAAAVRDLVPDLEHRVCVDSAPVLERDWGEQGRVGFIGKNTMLITPGLGSYTVLGELFLDVDAEPTTHSPAASGCGQCRLCLDACPTGAFRGPFELDARRCISYLTIELKGPMPRELRSLVGTRVFGCDVCQDVCPFNSQAPLRSDPAIELRGRADLDAPDLIALMALGNNQYKQYVAGTALRRVSRVQWRRNLCVALGNSGSVAAVVPLTRALADPHPVVRGHAAWALGRLKQSDPLSIALQSEPDEDVRDELRAAIKDAVT